jgi:hypothetical protein
MAGRHLRRAEDKLFVNDGGGSYRHAAGPDEVFRWPGDKIRDCGGRACVRRREPTVASIWWSVITTAALTAPQSVRLYLNRSRGSMR